MAGHGHVTPNPDGSKARCGGPGICIECSREQVAQLGRPRPIVGEGIRFYPTAEQKDQAIRERFIYHAPTPAQRDKLNECHDTIMACVDFLLTLPDGRDRAVALSSLEDTRMKMNKAVIFSDLG